jgi:spore photoproduct lyase
MARGKSEFMSWNWIRKIYIEKTVENTEITRRILSTIGRNIQVEWVNDGREVLAHYGAGQDGVSRGKRALLLSDFRGECIKPCPGTPEYVCCGYKILNFGSGCTMDCSYCALQNYFSNPLLTVQANPDAFLAAAAIELQKNPGTFYRLGTGEFADSLALDPLTGYARRLVEFIRAFPNAILELKSKATHVDEILEIDHQGKTICAWSVNSEEICRNEEFRVSPLEDRFAAASKVLAAGYKVAFHFDPIFYYEGWEEGYRQTIQRIFETAPADRIAWISLGCFRYKTGLEKIIRERFPGNRYTYGEFVAGGDGKMRYPQPLREHIYAKMVGWIREYGGDDAFVYFCMENSAVWRKVMGNCPRDDEELGAWLDERIRS